jgi:hypothetical protein
MLKMKRAGTLTENLTKSSKKNKRICNGRQETLDLIIAGLSTVHFSIPVLLQLFWSTHNCVPSLFFN